jgi:gas vesicle protein
MNISQPRNVTLPEIALIAITRGAIGFGAGLLLADKFKKELRKALGWSLFLTGVASTVPIAMHVLGKKKQRAPLKIKRN